MDKATQLAFAPETVDPRERMKEVRADVRLFVENGDNPWGINHIGEMYTDPKDMVRGMIALHDMLDIRIQRHNKASNHVADLLATQDVLGATICELNATNAFLNNAGEQLRDLYEAVVKENQKLKEDLHIKDRKLEAALITISTIMEG